MSQFKTEEKIVSGDVRITVTQFGARRAMELEFRLAGIAQGALVRGVLNPQANALPLLLGLFANLPAAGGMQLVDEILSQTVATVGGKRVELSKPSALDVVFTGNLNGLHEAIFFALQVNYGDFIAGKLFAGSDPDSPEASE